MTKSKKSLIKIVEECSVYLSDNEEYAKNGDVSKGGNLTRVLEAFNLHFFNDKVCNKLDNNFKLVPKYPEIEAANPEIKNIHHSIQAGKRVKIGIEFFSDGSWEIFLPKK